MKVKLIFAWYDLWIGFFWDKKKSWLYIFPLPTLGIILKFKDVIEIDINDPEFNQPIEEGWSDGHEDHPGFHAQGCECSMCLSDHMKSQLKKIEEQGRVIMKCNSGNHNFVRTPLNKVLKCTRCGKMAF